MVNETLHSQGTIAHCLLSFKSRLTPHTATPSLDAQVLLAHLTGQSRAWLLAHPETPLSSAQQQKLEEAVTQLENGLPLPYLLGEWEFFGLKFKVTPDTLIPRPETELLVETALKWIREQFLTQRRKEKRKDRKEIIEKTSLCPSRDLGALRGENFPDLVQAADIGTGTGCIAVSLAVHCPELHLVATDLSPAALAVARHNAQTHRVADRITFLEADLLPPNLQPSTFNLICANLPYIPTATLHALDVYGREPTLALDGGPDGLTYIRRLLSLAASRLAPGGLMLLEIEATQGQLVKALAHPYFPSARIIVRTDLAGHDRLFIVQTPAN